MAAAGHDNAVRVYDVRMASGSEDDFVMPVTKFVPHEVDQGGHITCVAWSKGGELAATYNMDNIYLFDASNCRAEREDRVLQKYEGHRNMDTVKGVAFYGHKDEYVVSGSDDGHIFLWDKHSAEICCLVKGYVQSRFFPFFRKSIRSSLSFTPCDFGEGTRVSSTASTFTRRAAR